ncbi:hypothetical protein NX801_11795 [Streptomyces sp. LP05-1]|uniref:Uncharacterized protein n=1 Tax=Streptomyces pyxinae TaxID=2970734 RepID=A0ABT2CFY4_9ACTN|nr:hypothetical protein [Streptomyces sp. LP05-1]MCS0636329.1 hypothetical protein [Streptomyces sp. LP05-1]
MENYRESQGTVHGRRPQRREPEMSLAELRGAGARMAPHWVVPAADAPAPVEPSRIHGVVVPPDSARLIASTASEYGA